MYYVFSMGLFMGGVGQLIAGMLEFIRKNILAATGTYSHILALRGRRGSALDWPHSQSLERFY